VIGKVAPFLELGVGFQPELTARDNVYIYGSILGLKRTEIKEKYEAIFDFAELKRFESMRLKSFSSGMYMRLAFATAVHTDPEVLLVDEVFAVGDEAFQKKSADKMGELKTQGKTIAFVSHNLDTVRKICDRCLLLDNGRVISIGETEKVTGEYLKMLQGK
jgi:lipopolysaccharide transport system ATP-binding protein